MIQQLLFKYKHRNNMETAKQINHMNFFFNLSQRLDFK